MDSDTRDEVASWGPARRVWVPPPCVVICGRDCIVHMCVCKPVSLLVHMCALLPVGAGSAPYPPPPAGKIIKAPNSRVGGQCSQGCISSGLINEAGELMRRKAKRRGQSRGGRGGLVGAVRRHLLPACSQHRLHVGHMVPRSQAGAYLMQALLIRKLSLGAPVTLETPHILFCWRC